MSFGIDNLRMKNEKLLHSLKAVYAGFDMGIIFEIMFLTIVVNDWFHSTSHSDATRMCGTNNPNQQQ